jgi:hypothetical protein
MTVLLDDLFVRRTAQSLLLLFGFLLCIICVIFDIIIILQYLGRINSSDWLAYTFVQTLSLPLQSDLAPIIAAAAGVFPSILAAACFNVDRTVTPHVASDKLNAVGHAFMLFLIVGLLTCLVAIILTKAAPAPLKALTFNQSDIFAAITNTFNALLSFQAIYLSQLIGLKPK